MVLLLVLSIWVATAFFEDDIKAYALEQLDAQLITQMQVESLDFTLIDHFPQASLRFNDVVIEETFEAADTLLAAETVYLTFNIWDLIGGNYTLESIDIQEAQVNLKRNESGDDNYHFCKVDSTSTESVALNLSSVTLGKSHFSLDDRSAAVVIDAAIEQGHFSGAFANAQFDLQAEVDALVETLSVGSTTYISQKTLNTETSIAMDLATSTYTFAKTDLTVGGIPLVAEGDIHLTEEGSDLDLAFSGTDTDVDNAVDNLPPAWKSAIAAYSPSGSLDFSGSIKGLASATAVPEIRTDFHIREGDFLHRDSGVALSDMAASGVFLMPSEGPSHLTISTLTAGFEEGRIAAQGSVSNFKQPHINVHLDGDLELNDLRKFANLQQVSVLEGQCKLVGDFEGTLPTDRALTRSDIEHFHTTGQISFSDAAVQLTSSPHLFEGLQGKFRLNNLNAAIDHLHGELEDSNFTLSGRFENLLPYALFDDKLHIVAELNSSQLDFNELLTPGESSDSEDYHLSFPEDISAALTLNVDRLVFRQFQATTVQGKADLKNGVLEVSPVRFQTSGGSFASNLTLGIKGDHQFQLNSSSRIENMDIQDLFVSFENFGQAFITDHHLRGKATAEVTFSAVLSDNLSFDSDKIESTVDITIRNGELIDLKSMQHIADYIDANLLVAPFVDEDALRRKLEHIEFATLTNEVVIRNGRIEIPHMDISSSAMDISCSGSHSFDNKIDYSLGFKVRDVLCKADQTEFGRVADDGLSNRFFLSMEGTSDDPVFGYDRLAHKTQRKADRQAETQSLKDVLRGGARNTGSDTNTEGTGSGVTVKVEWPEDEKPADKPKPSWRDRLKGKGTGEGEAPPADDEDEDDDF